MFPGGEIFRMQMQKRVAAIHDISCFGKCSITAALPVISALGTEAVALPTAVLSTHTGEFKNYIEDLLLALFYEP